MNQLSNSSSRAHSKKSFRKLIQIKIGAIFLLFGVLTVSGCSALGLGATPTPTLPPPTAAPTETPLPTQTETPLPTFTPTRTDIPDTPTPTVDYTLVAQATQESQRVDELFASLSGMGAFGDSDAASLRNASEYYQFDDFDEEWAQLYWYQWWPTGYRPENFILSVDASWESASRTANWSDSGCGFVFSASDENNHFAVFLAMDGYVRTHKFVNNEFYGQQGGYVGHFDVPADSAHIILSVNQQKMTVVVDDKKIVQYVDDYITAGDLALSLFSGTNKDFGTRCTMTNIELFILP
jgi:hypothetical protein